MGQRRSVVKQADPLMRSRIRSLGHVYGTSGPRLRDRSKLVVVDELDRAGGHVNGTELWGGGL